MSSIEEELARASTNLGEATQRLDNFYAEQLSKYEQLAAGYGTLAADLKGVVHDEMNFAATWDPDEPNPTNIADGVFASLAALVEAAPVGAYIRVEVPDKTVTLAETVYVHRKYLEFVPAEGAENACVAFDARVRDGENLAYYIELLDGAALRFRYVNVVLPAKADPALDWSRWSGTVHIGWGSGGVPSSVALYRCAVTASEPSRLVRLQVGHTVAFNSYLASADGPAELVSGCAYGIALLANSGLTVTNGAVAHDAGGTLGVNILES